MSVAHEIIEARSSGVVRCGLSSIDAPSIPELAAEFGLARDMAKYREIDAESALRLAERILHEDMAYNSEVMPLDRASELAHRFLDQFGLEGVRFFSNGTFHEKFSVGQTWSCVSWNPVTSATFDTGVLVIGPRCSGCLWVEDED